LRFAGHTFRITKQIGEGGSGFLWHAYDECDNEVAIKVLHKQKLASDVLSADPRVINDYRVSEIRREFDALKKVTASGSPFLTPLLYSFSDAENVYFVMRYYATDLYQHLNQSWDFLMHGTDLSFHGRTIKLWAAEILLGMQTLHSIGIMHGDLKTSNILITPAGHIAIADFGHSAPTWTLRTDCSGTDGYSAPEQHPAFRQKGYDHRADIYTYGLVLLDMTLGMPWYHLVGRNPEHAAPHDYLIQEAINHVQDRHARNLLYNNPGERLDWDGIKGSHFFRDIRWDRVAQREYNPGWTPCAAQKELHNPTSAIYSFHRQFNSAERSRVQAIINSFAERGEGLGALNIDYRSPVALQHDPLHGTACTRL
ncbi:kinase-like domain-containing protein, partial [Melanogaster broomeanus]